MSDQSDKAPGETPRWREDFPVRWEQDHYVTRRELAKFLTLGSALLATAGGVIAAVGRWGRRAEKVPDVRVASASSLPVGGSALFASRFREAAGRALLLPKRRPDRRTPLWQQRQRAADLLATAQNYPDFPILLETVRECINDVFDLPALRKVMTGIQDRTIRVEAVETPKASPFAQSLLFGWIATYMYEGDAPLAERRAAALALDNWFGPDGRALGVVGHDL